MKWNKFPDIPYTEWEEDKTKLTEEGKDITIDVLIEFLKAGGYRRKGAVRKKTGRTMAWYGNDWSGLTVSKTTRWESG